MNLEITREFKVVALREMPMPVDMLQCGTPERVVEYWNKTIKDSPQFNPECECFAVIFLTTRRKVRGHILISQGTMDTILVHPREVFRAAVIVSASAVVLAHNHPSGEAQPSEADIKVTRDLIRAGQLLKIEVLDRVVIGKGEHVSLPHWAIFRSP
jgi:DNA repair protein RadC